MVLTRSLLLRSAPVAGGALVVAEGAFHLAAGDAAAELAAHAAAVEIGEADVRAAQARLAQPGMDRPERHGAADFLEGLLEGDLAALPADVEAPAAHDVRRHQPEVGAAPVQGADLVGFPV